MRFEPVEMMREERGSRLSTSRVSGSYGPLPRLHVRGSFLFVLQKNSLPLFLQWPVHSVCVWQRTTEQRLHLAYLLFLRFPCRRCRRPPGHAGAAVSVPSSSVASSASSAACSSGGTGPTISAHRRACTIQLRYPYGALSEDVLSAQ